MTRRPALAAALAVLAAAATAQEPARDAARGYVESEAMQTALDELLSTETFVAQLEAAGLRLAPDEIETLAGIVEEEFAAIRPDLEAAMTSAAADAFTLEELEALAAFYQSPEGVSIAAKMTPFMQGFYDQIGPTLERTQGEIAARAQDALGADPRGAAPSAITE
jgi:hypothetical protein